MILLGKTNHEVYSLGSAARANENIVRGTIAETRSSTISGDTRISYPTKNATATM